MVTRVAPEWPHVADEADQPDVQSLPSGTLDRLASAVWANTFIANWRRLHRNPSNGQDRSAPQSCHALFGFT